MPLPPLLLERLKRRKIIQDLPSQDDDEVKSAAVESTSLESRYEDNSKDHGLQNDKFADHDHEEIIAEDYSDDEGTSATTKNDENKLDSDVVTIKADASYTSNKPIEKSNLESEGKCQDDTQEDLFEPGDSVLCCPNKYNIYHYCSKYCAERYGQSKNLEPTMEQRKSLALILKTYPMSSEWTVVYDPGFKTFYFWNIMTNMVSWLPPEMGGFISMSADQIRKSMRDADVQQQLQQDLSDG